MAARELRIDAGELIGEMGLIIDESCNQGRYLAFEGVGKHLPYGIRGRCYTLGAPTPTQSIGKRAGVLCHPQPLFSLRRLYSPSKPLASPEDLPCNWSISSRAPRLPKQLGQLGSIRGHLAIYVRSEPPL